LFDFDYVKYVAGEEADLGDRLVIGELAFTKEDA
jgi:hypothetical protein